jgi:hypothetical protein
MSIDNVYLIAEQPIHTLDTFCVAHEIVLSRRLLCRALAMQIAEELDSSATLPSGFETWSIPALVEWMTAQRMMLDLYALKLKLWMVLYTHRQSLHVEDSFLKPTQEQIDHDTLDDILHVRSFQDGFGEWMGQAMSATESPLPATSKVDVIALNAPDIPRYDDEELTGGFKDNPALASLVSDVLAGEQGRKKRRPIFPSFRRK